MKSIIASLYASGAQGLWTDIQGTPQLYTDTAGTTAATYGDSVARINDRSGRGNHLTQSTAGNRPVYARHPKGGIRNVLTYTEDFSNAAWIKNTATAVASNQARADGTGNCSIRQNITATASVYTCKVSMLAVSGQTRSAIGILQGSFVASTITVVSGPGTTESNGGLHCVSNLSAVTRTVVSVTTSAPLSAATASFFFYPGADRFGISQVVGDTVQYDIIQLETGTTATAYQKVTGWYDITESGVPSVPYLYFNGTSTSMATSAIDFSAGDKMTVFAAVRRLSDAARSTLVELGNAPGLQTWRLEAPDGPALHRYLWNSSGSSSSSTVASGYAAPITNVLTGIGDIAADTSILRVNGAQAATSPTDQGTGNYGNYPVYIGARAGTSLYFKGNLYDIAIVATNESTATNSAVENKLNSTVGAY